MTVDWSYRLNKDLQSFEVLQELQRTGKGLKLIVRTDHGDMKLWAPKKLINIYRYETKDGDVFIEMEAPRWWCAKVGLV